MACVCFSNSANMVCRTIVAANRIDLVVEQERPFLGRSWPAAIKWWREQLLVERARHLGHENRVVVVLERLVASSSTSVCMECPASWASVNTSSNTSRLVVHEDERVAVEGAGAEGAALLALIGVTIAPAAVQSAFERCRNIRCPSGCRAATITSTALLPRAFHLEVAEDRHVRVVMMNIAELHLPPANLVVAMHGRQVLADGGNEVFVHCQRHVVVK